MSKQSISIKLSPENLLWLRGRAIASGARSIGETIDQLISKARSGGEGLAPRSVVGTIEINENDSELLKADAEIRSLLTRSLNGFPEAKKGKRRTKSARPSTDKKRNRD